MSSAGTLRRWDNAVPMFCTHESRMGSCHKDAVWIVVGADGETVEQFLCDADRANAGFPLPAFQALLSARAEKAR